MRHPNNSSEVPALVRVESARFRLDAVRESRCAFALLVLLSLATVSVVAATSAFSHDRTIRAAIVPAR